MGLDLWLPFGFRYGPGMLSEVLQPGMGLFKRVLGRDPDNLLCGWHFHPGILFFPGVPLCSFLRAADHFSGIHLGLCLHDCLLSIRQDYLGELWWPFTWVILSSGGSFFLRCFYLHMRLPPIWGSSWTLSL